MTGKPIYSIETAPETEGRGNGDINSGNYQQGWHNLLWHTHRSLAFHLFHARIVYYILVLSS